MDDVAVDVCEPALEAVVVVGEAFVVEALSLIHISEPTRPY